MALKIQGDEDEGLHFAVEPTGLRCAGKIERSAEALTGKPLPDYLSLQHKNFGEQHHAGNCAGKNPKSGSSECHSPRGHGTSFY